MQHTTDTRTMRIHDDLVTLFRAEAYGYTCHVNRIECGIDPCDLEGLKALKVGIDITLFRMQEIIRTAGMKPLPKVEEELKAGLLTVSTLLANQKDHLGDQTTPKHFTACETVKFGSTCPYLKAWGGCKLGYNGPGSDPRCGAPEYYQ